MERIVADVELRNEDGDYLKRAALLLFHQDPENWFVGAYVKVVLNAIVHADHGAGNPIHIHIYPNEVLIYNNGRLPESWTADDLFARHTSIPHNPLIAGAFFRSGQIEAWGRGIEKITNACKEWGKPEPFYRICPNEVMIGFNTEPQFGEKFTEKFIEKFTINETQKKIINLMVENPRITRTVIAEKIGITTRGVQKSIDELKKAGIIERVGAAKGGHWRITA